VILRGLVDSDLYIIALSRVGLQAMRGK